MAKRTRKVPRNQARWYLAKAEEFVAAAAAECSDKRYTASGLAAVHAGICATDAITAHRLGEISSAPNHAEAVVLLRSCFRTGIPARHERQIVGLLAAKNSVEYSGQLLTAERSRTLTDQAARFVKWACEVVAPTPPGTMSR